MILKLVFTVSLLDTQLDGVEKKLASLTILPNSKLNSKKCFFLTRTRIKLFEFSRKLLKLLKKK